ncbi:MAG: IS110 family transposase [Candidatus Aminicenantes bacterium]|nr:IS110 family transposase [Candidatus Aminicenantes bacterium]
MTSYFFGCDASKGYCDFTVLDHSKVIVEPNFRFDDTYTGHQNLKAFIERFLSSHHYSSLNVGLESTGGYENNWYNTFLNLRERFNLRVARLNPYGVKHYKQAGLKRNKTDKISAQNIAEYLISYNDKVRYNEVEMDGGLKKQWKLIRLLTKQQTQLSNQFKSLLYNTHPQLLSYCKSSTPNWILEVVHRYPTARRLSGINAKTLEKIKYVTLERAKELISDARKCIGADQDELTGFCMKSLVGQIIHLQRSIKDQTKEMIKNCYFPEKIELLRSFKGIGEFSAVGIMLVIKNIQRFPASKKLVSFCGVHPILDDSGDKTGGYRMSKQGNKEMRFILYNVVMSAITSNEMIKKLYESYQEKGKTKMCAIGIMMNKILRIVYGMLKNNKRFDPMIDEANRSKNVGRKEIEMIDRDRRYQEPDEKAPISRRQAKKRKRDKKIEDMVVRVEREEAKSQNKEG